MGNDVLLGGFGLHVLHADHVAHAADVATIDNTKYRQHPQRGRGRHHKCMHAKCMHQRCYNMMQVLCNLACNYFFLN